MAYIVPDTGAPIHFDLTVSEMHEGTLEITEKPVERGSPITDNARQTLDKLTLVVFVTSSPSRDRDDGSLGGKVTTQPLDVSVYSPPFTPTPGAVFSALGNAIKSAFGSSGLPNSNAVLTFAKEFDAREDAERALRRLQNDKTLCQIVTTFRSYTSMILESFEMPVDADSGDGAEITLNWRQIRIVDTRTVTAPAAAQQRGQKAKDKGHKDPKQVTDAKKKGAALVLVQSFGIPVPAAGAIP